MESVNFQELLESIRSMQSAATLCFSAEDGVDLPTRRQFVESFIARLEDLQKLLAKWHLPVSARQAEQFATAARQTVDFLAEGDESSQRIAASVSSVVENELHARLFFAVSPERARFYSDGVGPVVAEAFPSTTFDATEAGRCFALGRYTACVFHLMRVLESGLVVFAKRFGVSAEHSNWHNVIEKIQSEVSKMGSDRSQKQQQEHYSQISSHFMVLKDAWRNYTAHARGKYTDDEAEIIFVSVRAFMERLAGEFREENQAL